MWMATADFKMEIKNERMRLNGRDLQKPCVYGPASVWLDEQVIMEGI